MELLELGQQLNLMERYKLTAEEVFLLELLFLASIEEGHQEYLVRYYSISKLIGVSIRDLLISLQKKGIINKSFIPILKQRTFHCTFFTAQLICNNTISAMFI